MFDNSRAISNKNDMGDVKLAILEAFGSLKKQIVTWSFKKCKDLGPVLLVNVGTVDSQRYQHCKNAEHSINCRNIDSRNIDISTVPLTFCIVVDQFFKMVDLIKINCQAIDIALLFYL
jgi:hypothetical protein